MAKSLQSSGRGSCQTVEEKICKTTAVINVIKES